MKNILFLLLQFVPLHLFAQANFILPVPPGRSQHAAAFDSRAGMMLVFGGEKHNLNTTTTQPKIDNKLWGWKKSTWHILSEEGPSVRHDAKMVYHEKNKKIYLYGGRTFDPSGKPIIYDDFWQWDGQSWNLLSQGEGPGKILHMNMIYDSHRNCIVLFGGVTSGKGFLNSLWEWDGLKWRETEVSYAPSPRIAHSMVYSSVLQRTLIIGGVSQQGENLNEIWAWDGHRFEQMDKNIPAIELGNYNAACIDKKNKFQLLLVGRPVQIPGHAEKKIQQNISSTWLWDGKEWEKLNLQKAPSLREGQSLLYDKKNKAVILFGGGSRAEAAYNNPTDVWVFKQRKWKLIQ